MEWNWIERNKTEVPTHHFRSELPVHFMSTKFIYILIVKLLQRALNKIKYVDLDSKQYRIYCIENEMNCI